MKHFLLLLIFICFCGCKDSKTTIETLANTDSKLISLFKASESQYPKISVHRGGKGIRNFPENCLETLKYVNDSITAIYEIDVAQTKDGQLILMHDNAVDRTTTGSGLVKNTNYNQLKNYNLIDDFGNTTTFKIPLFSDVLQWCKANNAILTVDIKRSVSQEKVINAIKKAKAKDVCIIITYDLRQSQSAYKLAPNMLLSVSARNHKELNALLASNIPTKNMLAFTGTRLSEASLFQKLHKENILCMLGHLGKLG